MKKFAFTLAFLALNLTALPQSFAQPLTLNDSSTFATVAAYYASYFGSGLHEVSCPEKQAGFEYKAIPYCFTDEGVAEIHTINGTPHLFLRFNANIAHSAGHANGGIGGLVVFKQVEKSGDTYSHGKNFATWDIVAKNPYIENGQWGISQLKDFKLVKIGSQKYGWAGEFEYSRAGGESNSIWTLYAPIGDKILPIVEEETAHDYIGSWTGGHWVETQGNVSILSNRLEFNGYYPIRVTRTTKTAPTNKDGDPIKAKIKIKNENYILVFNGKKFVSINSLL